MQHAYACQKIFHLEQSLFLQHVKSGVCGSLSCVSKTLRLATFWGVLFQIILAGGTSYIKELYIEGRVYVLLWHFQLQSKFINFIKHWVLLEC